MMEAYRKFFEIQSNKENRNTYYLQKEHIDHPEEKGFILVALYL
jgi:hypothetical protein